VDKLSGESSGSWTDVLSGWGNDALDVLKPVAQKYLEKELAPEPEEFKQNVSPVQVEVQQSEAEIVAANKSMFSSSTSMAGFDVPNWALIGGGVLAVGVLAYAVAK